MMYWFSAPVDPSTAGPTLSSVVPGAMRAIEYMSRRTGSRSKRSALALTPIAVLVVSTVGDVELTVTVSARPATCIVSTRSTARSRPTWTSDCSIVLKPDISIFTV